MRRSALLLPLLLTACTASAPAPDRTWTTELSTAPTLLALGPDDVWGASFGNGVGGSQVYRVERASGRRAAQRTLAGQPQALAVGPDGRLWLTTVRLPDQPGGTGLQVLDPATVQTQREVPLAATPLGLAFVGDRLWVGTAAGVHRLEGDALGPLRPTPEAALRLLAVGPDRLLALGRSTLTLLDAGTGRVLATRRVTSSGSLTATTDGTVLWVVSADAQGRAVLTAHDPATLAPRTTVPSPGRPGTTAQLADGALWVTDPAGRRLLCLDPVDGRVRATAGVAATGPVVADGDAVVTATATGLRSQPADC